MNDYKKPLEESNPPILPETKVETMFYRCRILILSIIIIIIFFMSIIIIVKTITAIIISSRVPEILQCHSQFRIALTEAVKNWDEVKITADHDDVTITMTMMMTMMMKETFRRRRSGTSLWPHFQSRSSSRFTLTSSTTSAR